MNNKYYDSKNYNWNRYDRPQQKETAKSKSDEDLIIEENTIYEIDRNCVERLKQKRKRSK